MTADSVGTVDLSGSQFTWNHEAIEWILIRLELFQELRSFAEYDSSLSPPKNRAMYPGSKRDTFLGIEGVY